MRVVTRIGASLLTICLLCLARPAAGQPFEPNESEVEHHVAALKLASDGNFEAAITEAEKAVAVRGLNVFWLNLGRFQQRAKQCAAAVDSFTHALTAPAVTDPPRRVVREKAQEYMGELVTECPAVVRLSCLPNELRVTAAVVLPGEKTLGPPMRLVCGAEVNLQGGTWTFVGTYGTESTREVIDLRAAREFDVRLEIAVPVAAALPVVFDPNSQVDAGLQTRAPRAGVKPGPVLMVVAGSLMFASGLVLDFAPVSSRNGELDAVDFVPLGLYLGSAALVVLGILKW